MTNITRNAFMNQLRHGVDLGNSDLNSLLDQCGVKKKTLDQLDRNDDNALSGRELRDAFRWVDGFDTNGSASSFAVNSNAHSIYRALEAGANSGPYHGVAISTAATTRAAADPDGYAYANAPTSPHPNLSGNADPGTTRPGWLQNQNKCNQFVGDALTQAQVAMPTFTMTDGSEHYMNAENLPHQPDFFDRITAVGDISIGDVIVVDYPEAGDSTAHTEVVTGTNPLRSTGAHSGGAYERNWSDLFDHTTENAAERCWDRTDGDKIYILRPNNGQ